MRFQIAIHSAKRYSVLALVLAGCGADAKETEAPPVEYIPNVETVAIQPMAFDDAFSLVGVAHAQRKATISAEAGGLLVDRPVAEGQQVSKGELILRLERTAYRAELESAVAAHRLAEKSLQRTAALAEKKLAGTEAVDQAEAQLQQAASMLTLARFRLDKTEIRAPFDGRLNRLDVELGELIAPGRPVAEILRLDPIEVHIQIPERDLNSAPLGGIVTLEIEALGEEPKEGRIVYVSDSANPSNKSYLAKIRTPNADGRIKDGMFARARFIRRRLPSAMVAPQNVIIDREEGHYLFVVQDGVANRRAVRLGPHDALNVVIESGLAPGEEIVRVGHRNLTDKQKIHVMNPDG